MDACAAQKWRAADTWLSAKSHPNGRSMRQTRFRAPVTQSPSARPCPPKHSFRSVNRPAFTLPPSLQRRCLLPFPLLTSLHPALPLSRSCRVRPAPARLCECPFGACGTILSSRRLLSSKSLACYRLTALPSLASPHRSYLAFPTLASLQPTVPISPPPQPRAARRLRATPPRP